MLVAGVTVRQLILTLALLALLAPAAATAQMIHRGLGPIHGGSPPVPPPQPPPLVAPPPIVMPLPSVLPPPDNGGASPFSFEASDPTRAHRDLFRVEGRSTHGSRYMPFIGGSYFGGYATDTLTTAPPASAPAPVTTGQLRLSVTPPDAQIFIDSYFVGLASDIDARRPLTLEAGPHRLEIRAPEHETQTLDVRILPYDTVTYRGALEPRRPAAAPVRPPATSSAPMYLIPNCYLGNVPPRASRLPSGCDIKQVQVLGQR
jgi:hypothetical protein